MDIKGDDLLNKFTSEVRTRFKGRLKKILFFGSRARGDFSPESDYDCILLLDSVSPEDEEFIDKLETKMLLKDFALFSTFLIEEKRFEEKKYEPFLMNAKKEGVFL